MNEEPMNPSAIELQKCVICGSRVEHENGGIRTNHRGNTINLCGSQCLKTFAEEPDLYLARLADAAGERAVTEPKIPFEKRGFQLHATYQTPERTKP